ncbi:hypothetical protein ILYODFUR_017282 [Ilyodon furcidens]|uniref:peptidylprolyl isomerase n=1 Tax=Ilyodon furcidens TaxID=33524 RepID=A0ABV0TVG0_9TELE
MHFRLAGRCRRLICDDSGLFVKTQVLGQRPQAAKFLSPQRYNTSALPAAEPFCTQLSTGRQCSSVGCAGSRRTQTEVEENEADQLQVETLAKPETCSVLSTVGDTLRIHYTGRLKDGKVIDSSLSRDPLVVELGKRTVIPGLEQSLIGVCEGQKIKATIPSHLAYGKKGYPPTIPGTQPMNADATITNLKTGHI